MTERIVDAFEAIAIQKGHRKMSLWMRFHPRHYFAQLFHEGQTVWQSSEAISERAFSELTVHELELMRPLFNSVF